MLCESFELWEPRFLLICKMSVTPCRKVGNFKEKNVYCSTWKTLRMHEMPPPAIILTVIDIHSLRDRVVFPPCPVAVCVNVQNSQSLIPLCSLLNRLWHPEYILQENSELSRFYVFLLLLKGQPKHSLPFYRWIAVWTISTPRQFGFWSEHNFVFPHWKKQQNPSLCRGH